MFDLLKEMFIRLSSLYPKSLSNQKCKIQPTLINLHPNEYNQELHYYSFAVKLDVLDVVIFLMTYLIKYVFQRKQKT